IQDGSMPKGGQPLDAKEQEMVKSFLDRKLVDIPANEQDRGSEIVFSYNEEDIEKQLVRVRQEMANEPEFLEDQILATKCRFNKIHCQNYLEYKQPQFEKQAQSMPESEREIFIQKHVMEIKCTNFFAASAIECREWKEKHPDF
nr:hypothetical protein [Bdellovibrionales bacterium]